MSKSKQKKLECPTLQPYNHFNFSTCHPSGWKQRNNDCWLDSALYALFGSKRLSDEVSSTLDGLAASKRVHERKFALNISNYLEGLNNLEWSDGDCKQLLKNNISNAIWDLEIELGLVSEENKEYAFESDSNGDVGMAALQEVFIFLSNVDPTIKYVTCNSNMPLSEFVPAALRDCSESRIIFLSAYRQKYDDTAIESLLRVENATLQSAVFGDGPHIIATTHCDDKFAIYDNQGDKTTRKLKYNDLNNADEVVFIYLLNPDVNPEYNMIQNPYAKPPRLRTKRKRSRKRSRTKARPA